VGPQHWPNGLRFDIQPHASAYPEAEPGANAATYAVTNSIAIIHPSSVYASFDGAFQ